MRAIRLNTMSAQRCIGGHGVDGKFHHQAAAGIGQEVQFGDLSHLARRPIKRGEETLDVVRQPAQSVAIRMAQRPIAQMPLAGPPDLTPYQPENNSPARGRALIGFAVSGHGPARLPRRSRIAITISGVSVSAPNPTAAQAARSGWPLTASLPKCARTKLAGMIPARVATAKRQK